jgi:hypothetical protein
MNLHSHAMNRDKRACWMLRPTQSAESWHLGSGLDTQRMCLSWLEVTARSRCTLAHSCSSVLAAVCCCETAVCLVANDSLSCLQSVFCGCGCST